MSTNLRKWLTLFGISCVSLTSLANADDNMHRRDDHHRRDMHHEDGKYREITPNAGPRVTNGADVFIMADFIYWTFRLDCENWGGSDRSGNLATLGNAGADPDVLAFNGSQPRIASKNMNNKFDPGFKVALGLNLDHDGWDTLLRYTWIQPKHTATWNANQAAATMLAGLSEFFNSGNLFPMRVSASYKYKFNNFDWELGRNFFVSQYLTTRPHAGLKGGWTRYRTVNRAVVDDNNLIVNSQGDMSANVDGARNNANADTWWIGIRTGLDLNFHFTRNWSLFSKTALSAVWEGWSGTATENVRLTAAGSSTGVATWVAISQEKYSNHGVYGIIEQQIGFCYDYWWDEDDYHFGIAASWEGQYWANQCRSIGISPGVDGAQTMQGFTLNFRFDF